MRRIGDVLLLMSRTLAALAVAAAARAAHAQAADEEEEPDTNAVAAADPSMDATTAFDEPVDLSTPFMLPSGHTIDASRFTSALPSSEWTSKAGVDNRDVTPYADLRLERWMPGALPQQT